MYVAMEHGALGASAAHQRGDYLADRPGSVLPAQSRWPRCSLGLCVWAASRPHLSRCLWFVCEPDQPVSFYLVFFRVTLCVEFVMKPSGDTSQLKQICLLERPKKRSWLGSLYCSVANIKGAACHKKRTVCLAAAHPCPPPPASCSDGVGMNPLLAAGRINSPSLELQVNH